MRDHIEVERVVLCCARRLLCRLVEALCLGKERENEVGRLQDEEPKAKEELAETRSEWSGRDISRLLFLAPAAIVNYPQTG